MMRQIKQRYESEVDHAYFITKRGEDRPSDKDPNRCIDSPDYAKMVISWLCQRPNSASNEKRLFDEYYKKLFSPQLDSQSMLALKLWLVEIDRSWESLAINEAVKAVRGAARFHMLFTVSQLFARAVTVSHSRFLKVRRSNSKPGKAVHQSSTSASGNGEQIIWQDV